ncbi:MAG: redoxin domain-containing protein [Pseudomonadota bacterium]|nr:redoxin domain-containing protein [Pseudomonadota bacterium]
MTHSGLQTTFPSSAATPWVPQIGAVIPDFQAESSQGPVSFHDWTQGSWVLLFSHYSAFSPVCTTEIALLAACQPEFRRRSVKLIGVSNTGAAEQRLWHADIGAIYDAEVDYPIIADTTRVISDMFGMVHRQQGADCAIRKSIIVDPERRIRVILEYPVVVGRSIDEILRVIDALQTADTYNVGTSADWQPGDNVLILPNAFGKAKFDPGSSLQETRPYLKSAPPPRKG